MPKVNLTSAARFLPVIFTCNICGLRNLVYIKRLGREISSCICCGSTVRMRSIIHLLIKGLYKTSVVLTKLQIDKQVVGIGLSDWEYYANLLQKKLDYTNTYYHKEPKLDILSLEKEMFDRYDFVISSDVFEHVDPPVSKAFENVYQLLKPGGLFVFSAPYMLSENTIEHFPELYRYKIDDKHQKPILVNATADGRTQLFEDLVFHGGGGATLEMRVFSEKELKLNLESAGFTDIVIHGESELKYGIFWHDLWSLPITARKPIAALDQK